MKRFICLFLSICMVCLNLPLISLAADTPSLTIECPKEVIPGEETDITVTLSNASDYTALEYCLTYDPEKFEIVSITEGDDFFFYFPIINPSYSDNQAHFSFALNSPCSTNGVVMTAKVRAKSTAAGVADFKIEHCKMSDGDMQPIMVSLDSKQTTIKTAQFSISSDVDKAISEDTVTAVISLIDGSAFSNFDYDVVYDNDKLEVISAKAYSKFEAIAQVNPEIAKNKIHMNFAAGRNFNYSGELMTVVFKVKNNTAGKAELSIDGALLVDENEKNLPVAIVGASIDIECTHKGVEWVEAKPANCKEDGLKEFKCDCGYYDSKSIPKGKHNYIPTIVPATKDTKGYTRYTCDGCQDSYEDDYVPALGYDVVFDANGGEFDVESQNKQPDASLILTDKEPARTGYTFEGWAKNKTADVAEYMPGDTYSVNEDVTLYAVWKINKYKIIYMIDGDTYKEYELEYNTEIVPEAAPVKEGYTFSGWSEIPSKMPANTVTVTGSFAANKHDIIYIVDGEEYKRVTLSYGSSVTPEQEPEKEGYTFSGWNGLPTLMPDNDVTVTGIFAVNKYKLVYKVDGAEYSSEEIEYGTPLAPKPLPTREGHTFSGWSEVPATMPAKDITVVGTFAVNKYKLVYKVDGAEYSSEEIEYGTSITPKASPTKEGYTFSGWSEVPATMPAKDVTVTGTFTINKYKLIYKVDGAEYSSEDVEFGASIVPKTAPTKEGYTFSGWSEIPSTMPAKDVTVTGTFSVNKYKLIYKVDGAEVSSEDVEFGAYILPKAAPTKEGYTFSGWSEIPSTMPAKDVTVTGVFTINKYKLIYKVDGIEYSNEEVEYGTPITPKAAPSKEGYTFSGWSSIPDTMPANDVIITGKFSLGNYKLIYMVDGAVYKTIAYGFEAEIVPEEAPTKEGYTFSGWSEIPSTMPAKDVTVTGTFTINKYNLIYMVDGAEYSNEKIEYGTAITPKEAPIKEGYTFSGWSEIPSKMPAKDVTVIGTFTINKYKLIYKVDGAEYSSEDVEFGASIVPKAAPTKEGYTFSGWSEIPSTMPARDITVTGVFTVNKYKLVYKVDGAEVSSEDVEFGSSIIPKAAPAKEGYTFSGWSEIPSTMPAKDITVTGSFAVNKYKLIYKVDDAEYASEDVEFGASIVLKETPVKEGYTFSGWSEVPATMPAKDVTVTGKFTINKYKLVYKVDGVEVSSEDVEFGAPIAPKAAPAKEGYTFSGWSEIPSKMPAKDITVTGAFIVNQYNLIYVVDGAEYKKVSYDYNAEILPEEAPIKDGYLFVRWENIPLTMPANDVEVTAIWERAFTVSGKAFFNDVATGKIEISVNSKTIVTNESGEYRIEKIVPGTYTITAKRGAAEASTTITIADSDIIVDDIKLTTIIIKEDYSGTKVIGIETLKEAFNEADKEYIAADDYNTITLDVTAREKDVDALENAADIRKAIPSGYKNDLYYVAISMKKNRTGNETDEKNIITSEVLHKVVIEIPDSMKNKQAYTIVRSTNGMVDTLTTTENSAGEKIEVSDGKIYVYTNAIDGFAIAYKQRSSSHFGGSSGVSRVSAVASSISDKEVMIGTKVSLTTVTKEATIYYTLDGTVPNQNSLVYSEPIMLTEDVTIKAIAVKRGMSDSLVSTFVYAVKHAEISLASPDKYMDAYDDRTFKPDKAIARYEVIKALSNVFNIQKTNLEISFNDVSEEYAELVGLFAGASIIDGYEDETFRGNNGITRAELVKILSIMLKVDVSSKESNFTDIKGHWAEEYINSFVELKYILGYPDGTFKPDNNISRAEFVVIINRIIKLSADPTKNLTDVDDTHWAYNEITIATK